MSDFSKATYGQSYLVTKLNLSGKDKQEKLKVIGNLQSYRCLTVLNLSDNDIEKIHNLDRLTNLKSLNLARNKIVKLDGLEQCSKLTTLNVNHNLINTIPQWLGKKLCLLKCFHLAYNCINDFAQLSRLQSLADLSVFSFEHNPAIEGLPVEQGHLEVNGPEELYRLLVLHHLPKLNTLDGREVMPEELHKASKRVEMRKLLRDTGQSSGSFSVKLDPASTETAPPNSARMRGASGVQQLDRIEKLEQELRLKDNLLRTRSDELARACLKHFELEQELAFHKIDSKMAALMLGPRPRVENGSIHGINSTGEQPYLGRCRSRIFPNSLHSPRFRSQEQLPLRPYQSVEQLPVYEHQTVMGINRFGTATCNQHSSRLRYQSTPKLTDLVHQDSAQCTISNTADQGATRQLPNSFDHSSAPDTDRPQSVLSDTKQVSAIHSEVDCDAGHPRAGFPVEAQPFELPHRSQAEYNHPGNAMEPNAIPQEHSKVDHRKNTIAGYNQPMSPTTQHSTASSRPSSRTAGTGRSAAQSNEVLTQQGPIKSDGSSSQAYPNDSDEYKNPNLGYFNGCSVSTNNRIQKLNSDFNDTWHPSLLNNSKAMQDLMEDGRDSYSRKQSMTVNNPNEICAQAPAVQHFPNDRIKASSSFSEEQSESDPAPTKRRLPGSCHTSTPVVPSRRRTNNRRMDHVMPYSARDRPVEDQTKKLLNMLIQSREECTSEMRKMRADINRMKEGMAELDNESDGSCTPVTNFRPTVQQQRMEATTSRQLPSTRFGNGTAHSFVDSWTTITRPTPNEDVEPDDIFDSPEDYTAVTHAKCATFSTRRPRRMLPTAHNTQEYEDKLSHNRLNHRAGTGRSKPVGQRLPRGRSLDARVLYDGNAGQSSEEVDEDPSTETRALANLTNELLGLRKGMKQARQLNANRLEIALKHISELELELQRQRCIAHDVQNNEQRQIERARWEKRLAATLAELKLCQNSISEMRAQMDSLEALRSRSKESESMFEKQQAELLKTRSTLDSQREEIARLNKLLNRLLGIGPDDISPEDLTQIQTGLVELNRRMQMDAPPSSQSVRRAQSWFTGLDRVTPAPSRWNPLTTRLLCNVPEHHYLEDGMGELQRRLDEMTSLSKEYEKKANQFDKMKRKFQKRFDEQNAEIERLNTDAISKKEEITAIRKQLDQLNSEKEKELAQRQHRLTSAASDLAQLEGVVSKRREEVVGLETRLREAELELKHIQKQIQEARSERETINTENSKAQRLLESTQSQLTQSKELLEQQGNELRRIQMQIEDASSSKQKIQNAIQECNTTIEQRQSDLKRLTGNITSAEEKLQCLTRETASTEKRLELQRREVNENDRKLAEQRAEDARLREKLNEDQRELDQLKNEITKQQFALEKLKSDEQKELRKSAHSLRELTLKSKAKQKELREIQSKIVKLQVEGSHSFPDHIDAVSNWDFDVPDYAICSEDVDGAQFTRRETSTDTDSGQRVKRWELNLDYRLEDLDKEKSEILSLITQHKRELINLRRDIRLESSNLAQLRHQRISSQAEHDHLLKQLDQRRSELQSIELQLSSKRSETTFDENRVALKQREHARLEEDLDALNRATRLSEEAKHSADEARKASDVLLHTALNQLDRTSKEVCVLDQRLTLGRQELRAIDEELLDKTKQLARLNEQIKKAQQTGEFVAQAMIDGTESNQPLENMEHSRLKQALVQSQRDLKQLKRRSTRDLAELERIAEEQCSRAGDLNEQLMLIKRQYSQLKGQVSTYGVLMDEVITIASQTELNEHGKRLEAALAAAKSELEQNLLATRYDSDILRVGSAPQIGVSCEPDPAEYQGDSMRLLANQHAAKSNLTLEITAPIGSSNLRTDAYESNSRTGMTTATSGLGSSLPPINSSSAHETSCFVSVGRETSGENRWKRKMANCAARQKEQIKMDRQSHGETNAQKRSNNSEKQLK